MLGFAIPTFNRENLLKQLVASIPTEFPIFISDNSNTIKDKEHFESRPLLKIYPCEQLLPMFENWNRAVACVDSAVTHIVVPSDDDLYISAKIADIESYIEKNPEIDIFVFGCDYIDENNLVSHGYTPGETMKFFNGDGFINFIKGVDARMPGIIFKKDFFHALDGFNTQYKLTASDSELVQRALLTGNSMFISETIGYYRIWNGSLTNARQATSDWLDEVDKWTKTVAKLISNSKNKKLAAIDVHQFSTDIYVTNLLSGYHLLVKKDQNSAKKFLQKNLKFRHASILNILRQVKYLLK